MCEAALATLSVIEEEGLLSKASARGAQLTLLLSELAGVRAVRGRGLLLAALLKEPVADQLVEAGLEEGLVVNNVRPDTVRFAPPLSISAAEVEEAARRFSAALGRLRTTSR